MAPMLEIVTISDSPVGAAFEVMIKRAAAADMMTPGRARLEGYSQSGAAALPRLLHSKIGQQRADAGGPEAIKLVQGAPEKPWARPPAAQKPKPVAEVEMPMTATATVGRTQELRWQRFVRRLRAHVVTQKILATAVPQLSRYTPTSRQERARKHNEHVARRAAELKKTTQARTEQQIKKLMRTAKSIVPTASAKKVASHNRKVFQKMVAHRQSMSDKAAQLIAKDSKRASDTLASTRQTMERRSEKAKAHNDKVKMTMIEHQQAMVKKSVALREKVMRPTPVLPTDARKEKAMRHNSRVLQKQLDQRVATANRVDRKREEKQTQTSPVKARSEKAARHNQLVMKRLSEHQSLGGRRITAKVVASKTTKTTVAVKTTKIAKTGKVAKTTRVAKMRSRIALPTTMSRRSKARSHNERVERVMEKHRGAMAEKVQAAQRRWGEQTSAVGLRTSAKWANRTLGARKHNAAVEAKRAEAMAAKAHRAKEIAKKLQHKAMAGEKITARRAPKNSAGKAKVPAPSSTSMINQAAQGTPAAPTQVPVEEPRRSSRLSRWLARILPCIN